MRTSSIVMLVAAACFALSSLISAQGPGQGPSGGHGPQIARGGGAADRIGGGGGGGGRGGRGNPGVNPGNSGGGRGPGENARQSAAAAGMPAAGECRRRRPRGQWGRGTREWRWAS